MAERERKRTSGGRKSKKKNSAPPRPGAPRRTPAARTSGAGHRGGGSKRVRPRGARIALAAGRWTLIGGIWAVLVVVGIVAWYAYDLPRIDTLETPARRASITLLDADGGQIASYGDLYGDPVGLADVPPYLVQAIVAIEDRRFFDHGGFDPLAVVRAAVANIRAGSIRQGGSTLTQQLAKNLFLQPDRTLRRKVQELLLAFWLEANFSKEQIFTLYINRVYLGSGAYGVDAAARRYFGKSAREVNLLEAAALAGLLKAPSRYSPINDAEAATRRAHVVLNAMVDAGFLDAGTARRATSRKLQVVPHTAAGDASRYFADWALEQISGFVGRRGEDLVVRTTLDPRLQRLAEARVEELLERRGKKAHIGQGALVSMSSDGAVRALVGGRDYASSQFNRAFQARRQPGSAFKLFVYLAAMENGLTPDTRFIDGPLRIGKWRPSNYDGDYRGTVTLREAMARSINTVAVQVSERVGRQKVIDAARRLGITTPLAANPSLALGASEVTLLELTAAYAVLANGGVAVWPHAITEIHARDGRALYRRTDGGAPQVVEPQTVIALNDMLRAVVVWGTGKVADPGRPAAGKTGTSQDFRDAWYVGFTRELVSGVWLGNDDGSSMKGVTGGGLPARLWGDFTRRALSNRPVEPLGSPPPAPPRDVPTAAAPRDVESIPARHDRLPFTEESYNKGD